MFNIVDIQDTPNPDARKFILDSELLAIGVRHFETLGMSQGDPVAAPLFSIEGVMTVFYMRNFVTVTKFPEVRWKEIEPKIKEALQRVTVVVSSQGASQALEPAAFSDDDELLKKINLCLDQKIRPALSRDGGGLNVLGLQAKTLAIRYQGACGSCPSASMGTMIAIQNLLRQDISPELTVVAG